MRAEHVCRKLARLLQEVWREDILMSGETKGLAIFGILKLSAIMPSKLVMLHAFS